MKKIRCNYCKKDWYMEADNIEQMQVCPYCIKAVREKVVLNTYDSLDKILYKAVTEKGIEILSNSRQLSGYLLDIAPALKKEVHIFTRTFNEYYLNIFKNVFDKDIESAKIQLLQMKQAFIDNEGLSRNWADMLYESCLGAVVCKNEMNVSYVMNVEIEEVNLEQDTEIYGSEQEEEIPVLQESLHEEPAEYNAQADFCYKVRDYEKAWEYYLKSAERGNAKGQYFVGYFYQYGIYVDKDIKMAIEYYEKAGEQGDVQALVAMGQCYENGEGVVKNYGKAIEYYESAAKYGSSKAQFLLGVCYRKYFTMLYPGRN